MSHHVTIGHLTGERDEARRVNVIKGWQQGRKGHIRSAGRLRRPHMSAQMVQLAVVRQPRHLVVT